MSSVYLRFKAIIFGILLFSSAFFGTIVFGGGPLPSLFFLPSLYRRVFDPAIGAWEWLTTALLEKWLGLKVVVTGDRMLRGEQSLIVMNHRTCLDWLYFWSVLVRQSGVSTEKIILKSPLKHVPGAGWAMQAAGFFFLNRKWEEDEAYMKKMIDYFYNLDYPTQILLFPEGTDYNEKSKSKSNSFASKNNLPPYENVLHPRTTGFTFLVQQLKQKWPECVIYDVTVGYPHDSFPQTEYDLMSGHFTPSVHFDVRRHLISSLPDDPTAIDEWCRDIWTKKENTLEIFKKSFSFKDIDSKINCESKQSSSENSECRAGVESWVNICQHLAIIGWILFDLGFVFLLYWSALFRWIVIFHVVFFIYMDRYKGGFEIFQAQHFLSNFVNKIKDK